MNRIRLHWILVRENEAAWQAVARVRRCILRGGKRRSINPLFLHGPSGTGKTYLLGPLREEVQGMLYPAGEIASLRDDPFSWATPPRLVLVEDVQRLSAAADSALAALVDRCISQQIQLIISANTGPALLMNISQRLASRLASGLVVGLGLFGLESRRHFLQQALGHANRMAPAAVIDELAALLPGSVRVLEGAVQRLLSLDEDLTLPRVRSLFAMDDQRPTLERIVARVSDYFQVAAADLRSARRSREVMMPRQVSMYLARQLTGLSLGAIGEEMGGRDHTTVLHACRKIEEELQTNANLSRAVRELAAGLS
jgi:chromosomal replication initiator protein